MIWDFFSSWSSALSVHDPVHYQFMIQDIISSWSRTLSVHGLGHYEFMVWDIVSSRSGTLLFHDLVHDQFMARDIVSSWSGLSPGLRINHRPCHTRKRKKDGTLPYVLKCVCLKIVSSCDNYLAAIVTGSKSKVSGYGNFNLKKIRLRKKNMTLFTYLFGLCIDQEFVLQYIAIL